MKLFDSPLRVTRRDVISKTSVDKPAFVRWVEQCIPQYSTPHRVLCPFDRRFSSDRDGTNCLRKNRLQIAWKVSRLVLKCLSTIAATAGVEALEPTHLLNRVGLDSFPLPKPLFLSST
jgi:hypothetical protein